MCSDRINLTMEWKITHTPSHVNTDSFITKTTIQESFQQLVKKYTSENEPQHTTLEVYTDSSSEFYRSPYAGEIPNTITVTLIRNTMAMMISKIYQLYNRDPALDEIKTMAKEMIRVYPGLKDKHMPSHKSHNTIAKRLRVRLSNIRLNKKIKNLLNKDRKKKSVGTQTQPLHSLIMRDMPHQMPKMRETHNLIMPGHSKSIYYTNANTISNSCVTLVEL